MKSVEQLRLEGNKVRVKHYRIPVWDKNNGKIVMSPRGGFTVIDFTPAKAVSTQNGISYGDPECTFTGVARCNKADNYCKKTGVELALSRCFEQVGNL